MKTEQKIEIDLKEEFTTVIEGTHYTVPIYEVIDGKGIVKIPNNTHPIYFVRGSKIKDEKVEKKEGTLHEHLLTVMIHDLKYKNSLVPSREGSLVITKLEEALGWLRQRQIDRKKRSVEGTYKK